MNDLIFLLDNKTDVFFKTLAALIVSSVIYLAAIFPVANLYIVISLLFYVLFLLRQPTCWLIVLPIITVVLHLTPWSGRFIFNELDFYIYITIGVLLFKFPLVYFPTLNKKHLLVLLFSFLSIYSIGLIPEDITGSLLTNPYHSSLLKYKVGKGIIWAAILAWFFHSQYQKNQDNVIKHLIYGSCISAFSLFIIILWERNFLTAFENSASWYQVLSSLLDITSTYRATSIMSDMHTGGESLDGIYLLLFPLLCFGISYFKSNYLKLCCLLALLCVFYCVLVGFTRATYVSVLISIVCFILLMMKKSDWKKYKTLGVLYFLTFILTFILYSTSGYYSILSLTLLLISSTLLFSYKSKVANYFYFLLMTLISLSCYVALKGYTDSQWVEQNSQNLFTLITICSLLVVLSIIISYKHTNLSPLKSSLSINALFLLATFVAILMFAGSHMKQRMTNINSDLHTRMIHWSNVIDSSNQDLKSYILGNGLGSFPLNYLVSKPDLVRTVGTFSTEQNANGENVLILGSGKDLAFGQRLHIYPNIDYKVELEIQSKNNTIINISLCERNLIVFDRWTVNCEWRPLAITASQSFQFVSVTINSKNVGLETNPLKRWPTVFLLRNDASTELLAIRNINVTDSYDNQLIKNDDFQLGLDHWFFYHDFEHLAWHIKNIYLSIYYQLGAVGILLFSILVAVGVHNTLNSEGTNKLLNTAFLSITLGFLAFGLFGDPLDSPRVSWFYYLTLFSLVMNKTKP